MVDTIQVDIKDKDVVDLLRTLGDPHRLQILCMLREGERCVCEIHGPLSLPQNLTSHHLKTLRDSGLVKTRKEGRNIIYSLDAKKLKTVLRLLENLTEGGR